MKNEETKTILEEAFIWDILELCDGKYNIQDISKKIDLSYRSTFFKIKALKEAGIVTAKENKISLTEKAEKKIKEKLKNKSILKDSISKAIKEEPKLREIIIKYLEMAIEKRFTTIEEVYANIEDSELDWKDVSLPFVLAEMDMFGYTRSRREITREGRKFLEQLKQL